jgi:hypothetical protein
MCEPSWMRTCRATTLISSITSTTPQGYLVKRNWKRRIHSIVSIHCMLTCCSVSILCIIRRRIYIPTCYFCRVSYIKLSTIVLSPLKHKTLSSSTPNTKLAHVLECSSYSGKAWVQNGKQDLKQKISTEKEKWQDRDGETPGVAATSWHAPSPTRIDPSFPYITLAVDVGAAMRQVVGSGGSPLPYTAFFTHDTKMLVFCGTTFWAHRISRYTRNFFSNFFNIFKTYLNQNLKTRSMRSHVPKHHPLYKFVSTLRCPPHMLYTVQDS